MARLGPALAFGALSGIRRFQQVRGQREALEQAAGLFEGLGSGGQELAHLARTDQAALMRIAQQFGGFQNLAGFVRQQHAQEIQQQQFGQQLDVSQQRLGLQQGQLDVAQRGVAVQEGELALAQGQQANRGGLRGFLQSPLAVAALDAGAPISSVLTVEGRGTQGETTTADLVAMASKIVGNAENLTPESQQQLDEALQTGDPLKVAQAAVNAQRLPKESTRLDVTLGQPTSATTTNIQEQFISLSSLIDELTRFRTTLDEPGAESAFGIQGSFGEAVIDGLVAQVFPDVANEQRIAIRSKARLAIQRNLRNISEDERFTDKERIAVRELIALLEAGESLPQVKGRLDAILPDLQNALSRLALIQPQLQEMFGGAQGGAPQPTANVSVSDALSLLAESFGEQ